MSADTLTTIPPAEGFGPKAQAGGECKRRVTVLHRLQTRIRRHGVWRTWLYLVFVVVGERCGVQFRRRFEFDRNTVRSPEDLPAGFQWSVASRPEHLTESDHAFLSDYGEHDCFPARLADRERCLIVRTTAGELASVCWFRTCDGAEQPVDSACSGKAASTSGKAGIIERCFTRYEHRGLGLYRWSLQHIATSGSADIGMNSRRLLIECSPFNHASERGITRAGFRPAGTRLNLRIPFRFRKGISGSNPEVTRR